MTRLSLILRILCVVGVLGASGAIAHEDSQQPTPSKESGRAFTIPNTWTRRGVVIKRQAGKGGVSGDPCIVWDEAINGWRMVLFYDPPGHAQAICLNRDHIEMGPWKLEGPLPVTNPKAV